MMALLCWQGEESRKALCTLHWPCVYTTVLIPVPLQGPGGQGRRGGSQCWTH